MTFSASAADPYVLRGRSLLTDPVYGIGYNNTDGMSQQPRTISWSNNAVIITGGQSQTCNFHQGPYTPSASHNLTFNIHNGGLYTTGSSSILGCDGVPALSGTSGTAANFAPRLLDKFVTAGKYGGGILVPMGMAGSNGAQWATGGVFAERIGVTARRLAAATLTPTMVIWDLGPTDAANGTSQATFTAQLQDIIGQFRAAGITCPFFVNLSTFISGSLPAGSSAIRAAQAAVVDNISVYAGGDTDTITVANRYDTTHYNATGSDQMASLVQTAVNAKI